MSTRKIKCGVDIIPMLKPKDMAEKLGVTVKPSQLKNLVIAINTGQYGTLSITSVKLTML